MRRLASEAEPAEVSVEQGEELSQQTVLAESAMTRRFVSAICPAGVGALPYGRRAGVRKLDRTENMGPMGRSQRDVMPTLRSVFSDVTSCYARLRRER